MLSLDTKGITRQYTKEGAVGTLYDVLQVSPEASPEIIKAAYERLCAVSIGHDIDAENRQKALNEAFFTLGNPEKRQRYDARLASLIRSEEVTATKPSLAKYATLGLIAAAGIFGYVKHNQNQELARVEKERLAVEARKAELAAQQEADQLKRERDRLRDEQIAEQQQRNALDRARRESDVMMQTNMAAQESVKREAERRQRENDRQIEQTRQKELYEAQQRVEREKALARQLEAENSRYRRRSY